MPGPHNATHGSHREWPHRWAVGDESPAGWDAPWGAGPPNWRMPRAVSLWLPVIVAFVVQVPAAIWIARMSELPADQAALTIVIAAAGPLALIGARRFPGPVVAFTALAAGADLLIGPAGGPPYLAFGFAIIGAIVRGARIWVWLSIGIGWVGAVILALIFRTEPWTPVGVTITTIGLLIAVGIGEGIANRRRRVEEFRSRYTQRRQTAVEAERVRIARELHDVLAHSLSQINVQAGVGLHLMDSQPEQARAALASIKESSKVALDEVRSVLGVLRSGELDEQGDAPLVPQPDLRRLSGMAASTVGLNVEVDDRLDHTAIPQAVQSAVFRIVQEALTNASRHADGATRVEVRLELVGDAVEVEITDDGTGSRRTSETERSGEGGGLLGMRERAELLGGTLEAGPGASGGFRVFARLPLSLPLASLATPATQP